VRDRSSDEFRLDEWNDAVDGSNEEGFGGWQTTRAEEGSELEEARWRDDNLAATRLEGIILDYGSLKF